MEAWEEVGPRGVHRDQEHVGRCPGWWLGASRVFGGPGSGEQSSGNERSQRMKHRASKAAHDPPEHKQQTHQETNHRGVCTKQRATGHGYPRHGKQSHGGQCAAHDGAKRSRPAAAHTEQGADQTAAGGTHAKQPGMFFWGPDHALLDGPRPKQHGG